MSTCARLSGVLLVFAGFLPQGGAEVTLRFAGDCLLAGYYQTAVGKDIGYAFEGFDLLETADISMVNLECPITERGMEIPKPYNFRMHPSFISALKRGGIDIVNIANNHIYDYGRIGLFDTISYLDSSGILHVGAGRNESEAHRAVIRETGGKRIAFLGYYGGGEAPGATRTQPGVARREISRVRADIEALKTADSIDYIVVNVHWGTEKAPRPDHEQISFAHQVIDAGANAVIGHHPHVLQGIERYRSGMIAYSLGNFVFGGNSRDTYDTAVLEIALTPGGPDYRVIPVRLSGWKLSLLQGAEAQAVLKKVQALSKGFPQSIFTKQEIK